MRRADIVCQGLPHKKRDLPYRQILEIQILQEACFATRVPQASFIKDHERVREYQDALPMVVHHCGKSFINPAR
jgi:hypothetical protein